LINLQQHGMTRGDMVMTVGLALVCAALTLGLYYTAPIPSHPHGRVWLRLVIGFVIFSAAVTHEVNAILRHDQPMRRAVVALAVLLPLLVGMFSWTYLTMSRSDPAAFGGSMTRTTALYFTVTVLSTVGFGDITPKTDVARVATMCQMAADLIVLAVVVRLILNVASEASAQRRSVSETSEGSLK
jgi:voltage-gated potassium channel